MKDRERKREKERERKRERDRTWLCANVCDCVWAGVCEGEREMTGDVQK